MSIKTSTSSDSDGQNVIIPSASLPPSLLLLPNSNPYHKYSIKKDAQV